MSEEKKKCRCGCKVLKFLLWGLLGIALFTLLMVATIPLWISPVATGVANCVVPKVTGTGFHMDRCYFNPYSGSLRVAGVRLSNPEGFGDAPACSVSSFAMDVKVTSLLSDTIVVDEILIEDPFASYYSHDGKNNIDVILENVNNALGVGGEEKEAKEEKEEPKSEKKIIIGHLRIAGTRVKLMKSDLMPNLAIPTIDIRDIGVSSGGVSFSDAWSEIVASFTKAMGSIGDGIGALGGMLGDGAKGLSGALSDGVKGATSSLGGLTDKVGGAIGSIKDSAAVSGTADAAKSSSSAVGDAAKSTSSAVGDAAKSTAGVVGDAAKSTADAVGDATVSAVNAVGDATKSAAGVVGDTAKKATEGVKNLFKGVGK